VIISYRSRSRHRS